MGMVLTLLAVEVLDMNFLGMKGGIEVLFHPP
jgi:hypothetical protein